MFVDLLAALITRSTALLNFIFPNCNHNLIGQKNPSEIDIGETGMSASVRNYRATENFRIICG